MPGKPQRWMRIVATSPAKFMLPRGRGAAAVVLVASLCACIEPKPVSYPTGTTLPFGKIGMSVHGTEASSEGSHKSVLVHVTMSNLESQSQARVASQSWQQFFRLEDRNEKTYRCRYILPSDYYYKKLAERDYRGTSAWGNTWSDESTSSIPTEWVLLFQVPLDAQGFTLLVNNSTFGTSGQPGRIAVALDR